MAKKDVTVPCRKTSCQPKAVQKCETKTRQECVTVSFKLFDIKNILVVRNKVGNKGVGLNGHEWFD